MAIIDTDFQAWVEQMRREHPQAFHDLSVPEPRRSYRYDLCRMAFMAGKKAGRQAATGGEG